METSIDTPHGNGLRRINNAMRLAVGLTAIGCILLQGNAMLQAEAPPALIISKDGANVNVSLDSQTSSDVSIRRSDDIMMIKVPKSFPSRLVIDPSLKKDDIVQETDTEGGKTILIHSQQIYLMTRENLQEQSSKPTADNPKPSAQKTAEANIHAAVDTSNPTSGKQAQLHPVSHAAETTAANKAKQQAQLHQPPTIPVNIPSILAAEQPKPTDRTKDAEKTGATDKDKSNAKKENSPPKVNAQPAVAPEPIDPESLPIDLSGKQQTTATEQSTGIMIRITLSLVAVLVLLIGFIHVVLPKLMERYPEFFENLQQQAHLKQESLRGRSNDDSDPAVSKLRSKKSGLSFRSVPKRSFNAPVKYEPDSKRAYLERLNVNGTQLNVLSSTPLGKGSELHLVEVHGRQLVIATTPYTVSFVKDLSEPDFESAQSFFEPEPNYPSEMPRLDDRQEDAEEPIPSQNQTIAYLSDDSPVVPAQKKPYGSVAHTTQQASITPPDIQSAAVANLTTQDTVHQKYLNDTAPQDKRGTTEMALDLQPSQPSSSKPHYVDAEEVIVLEDYDDVYGH